MTYISVTNTFANKTRTDASLVNKNFKDITDGLFDGTKDINVNKITADNLNTTDLDVVNMTVTTDFNITNKEQFRINLYTQGFPYYCFKYPSILDLELTDADLVGFKSGFEYGRYIYFIPSFKKKIVRIDKENFSASGITVLDLGAIDADLSGFSRAFTDGQFGYAVPYDNGGYFGKFVRFLLSDFTDTGVSVLNLESLHSELVGFRGGFTDGKYAYLIPYAYKKLCRVDLNDFSTATWIILSNGSNWYMFTDGVYFYCASGSTISKIKLSNFTLESEFACPISPLFGINDGRYGYFINLHTFLSSLVRIDLHDVTRIETLNLYNHDHALSGMQGMMYDGRYIYITPFNNGTSGTAARVDTHDFSTIETCNFTLVNAGLKGYYNCFSDGYWGYFIPYYDGTAYHGKVARILLQ